MATHSAPARARQAVIIAVVSRKGGVGKTTTAVNLAAALAGRHERTLLIDLDSQASASASLGVERRALAPSSADVLLRALPVAEAVRGTSVPYLELVTASVDLISLESDLGPLARQEAVLRRALEPVLRRWRWVIVDCPPSLTMASRVALGACDGYIIPAIPHFLALAGIEPLLEGIDRIGLRSGRRPRLLGVLLTLVDRRTRTARDFADQIRARYFTFDTEIRINTQLAEAPAEGKTIFEHAPESSGAFSYRSLAAEMVFRLAEDPCPPVVTASDGGEGT